MAQRAKFPFISSNIIDKETGKPAFKPYIIREMNGLRIGIISLISKDVLDKRKGQALEEFGLQDPYLTAETIVAELRDQTDFIILLSHQGHQANRQFAKRVRGINIIVGGHTGVPLYNPHVVNETLILQNSAYGRNIGSIDIEFSNGKVSFANADIMKSLRETLRGVEKKIRSLEEQEPGKQSNEALASTLGYKDILKKKLQTYGQKNPFRNRIVRFDKRIPSDPDVLALVEGCKRKLADLTKKKKSKGCGSDPQS